METPVLFAQEGAVALITLNRPTLRNPISDDDMMDGLLDALKRIQADKGVRAAVLTGAGTAFSSGGNLRQMGASTIDRPPVDTRHHYNEGIQRIPRMFESLEVPIVAAVNGPAIGAGLDLACMCDIRFAAESATFAESFVKVGIIPGDGGAWLLQRLVGYSKACEMAFTGDLLSAAEALACGLVTKVVPDSDLMDAAMGLAQRIAGNPPHVLRMTKRLQQQARMGSMESVLQLSSAMQSLVQTTADHVEAVQAILEKRAPIFTGQ